ncbi:MAG: hypothetical protein IPK82_36585 [Polyangiaceae bacterium]|nr:hypothetical protein [Polyangiaceae bacterium]
MALRAKRVPAVIRALFMVAAVIAIVFTIVADLPPYSLIADAQAALFNGEHYPVISVGLTAICFLSPAGAFIQVLAGYFPEAAPPPNAFGASPFGQGPFPQGPNPYQPGPYWQGPNNPQGLPPGHPSNAFPPPPNQT